MSALIIAGALAITLLSVTWYVLYQAVTFELDDLSFTETEVEQMNKDFTNGLRNYGR
tara:strand:+ start:2175 stop:2345 length:171 start_codon:yes stop_codon:yes gene_type:complete